MTPEFFAKAVDSLKGFGGMIGVMGGEPTLHPKFGEIVDILAAKVGEGELPRDRTERHDDFSAYRNAQLAKLSAKRGLWTSLGSGYYRHFEKIQDTFGYQCINDHRHNGEHMALLMPYNELGFSREEFVKLRDDCWLQREWSACITPKGAFFCEVAGALDMLFGGAGGWPVEPGWWKREPKDFGDQLRWCDMCGACLPVPKRRANEGVDDVTPGMAKLLKHSAKKMNVVDVEAYRSGTFEVNRDPEPYIADNKLRVAGTNNTIKPKKISAVMVCAGYSDYLDITLPHTVAQCDETIVVTEASDTATQGVCLKHGAKVVLSSRLHEGGAPFAKGKAINDGIASISSPDWILVMDADVILGDKFGADIRGGVLNPGCLYFTRRWGPEHTKDVQKLVDAVNLGLPWDRLFPAYASREVASFDGRKGNAVEAFPFGYFQLFHIGASALAGRKTVYPETSRTAEHDDLEFGSKVWPKEKLVQLPAPQFDVIHLPHGRFRENWGGRKSPMLGTEAAVTRNPQQFVCSKDCTYKGRVYRKGDRITTDDYALPKHFERVA